ncbi:MAG: tRNA 2-thiouridine(34) synthase MnmA [Eubacteriales bacterium]
MTLKLYDNEDIGISREKTCCSLDDVEDARSVACKLGIPFYVLNFSDSFKSEVVNRFVNTYKCGGTPNPCIDCNRYIKFDKLMLRAKQLDFDYVVTGHYANVEYDSAAERYLLKKAVDSTKDQSYVLYSMTQELLSKTLFPLGNLKKTEVRELALENDFINAKKHDSQDICFVKDGDYAKFIEDYSGEKFDKGSFVDTKGNKIGEHKGIIHYTIGQRKGLGLSFPKPMFVCSKDISDNTVTLGEESKLYTNELDANDINLIAYSSIEKPMRLKAKVRYKQEEQWATVEQTDSNHLHLKFDLPQRAIAKGQAVVLYDSDTVVGGGTIV